MTDYFNYDVHFVMNITDIDDKVSLASRTSLKPYSLKLFARSSNARAKSIFLRNFVKKLAPSLWS